MSIEKLPKVPGTPAWTWKAASPASPSVMVSVPLARRVVSSRVMPVSLLMMAVSATGVTLMIAVVEDVPPWPSEMV
ncbi:hypothetical protein ETQ85_24220 [Zoogloea oleivorans]|uniref:Uncharacterized protein n=1 Tax=Zoogloea oleivorans TaxID=1552750 RepID=A0A6C2CBZ3_9RHOO|nr:hypothetical protein ETQ85_24220 [Zoogloea oleivorans]